MKICVLATSYPRNANDHASVFVHGLSRGMVQNSMEVTAIVPHEKGLPKKDIIEGVKIRRFQYFWPSSLEQVAYGYGIPENLRHKIWAKIGLPFFVLFFFLKAWRYSKGSDILHAHWEISAVVAIFISTFRKIPIVLTVHRLVIKNPIMKCLTKWIFKRMSMLHFNSTYTQEIARELLKTLPPHEIIYPSIDTKYFTPGPVEISFRKKFKLENDHKIILGLGRLVEKKGFCYLLEGFAKYLHKNSNSSHMIIAGGGPELTNLKKLSQQLNIETKVHFTDFILPHEIRSLLRESSVMVLPSIVDSKGEVETLGVVSMEAMACEVPVIASNVGGIPDVIEDQISGILFEPKNPDGIANALEKILKDSEFRNNLIQNAKERVLQNFTWERAIQQTQESYQRLLRN